MLIDVTEQDIEAATIELRKDEAFRACICPVARAIKRRVKPIEPEALNGNKPGVYKGPPHRVVFINGENTFMLPAEVNDWVEHFDGWSKGQLVTRPQPISFEFDPTAQMAGGDAAGDEEG